MNFGLDCISAHGRGLTFWQAYCLLLTTAQLLVDSHFAFKDSGHLKLKERGHYRGLSFYALNLWFHAPGELLEWFSAAKILTLFFLAERSCMVCGSL